MARWTRLLCSRHWACWVRVEAASRCPWCCSHPSRRGAQQPRASWTCSCGSSSSRRPTRWARCLTRVCAACWTCWTARRATRSSRARWAPRCCTAWARRRRHRARPRHQPGPRPCCSCRRAACSCSWEARAGRHLCSSLHSSHSHSACHPHLHLLLSPDPHLGRSWWHQWTWVGRLVPLALCWMQQQVRWYQVSRQALPMGANRRMQLRRF
mmetsp:Transcript_82/g.160  ORF Transcript_82/g.160 Transcript_82/m.160 type:complete len:211 (-) Transcript_82:403-1035(-)